MAWFTPKKPWKAKESKVEVKETQIGPNSVRYDAVKKEGGYKSPNLSAPYKFGKLSSPKKAKKSYWDTYKDVKFDDDDDDYYPDRSFSGRTTYGRALSYQRNLERPVVTRKEFEFAPTRWSSFSFSAYSGNTDSNINLFVKEPEGYITPSKAEIQVKIHVYSDEAMIVIKELCRLFYFKMLDEPDYITENIENIIGLTKYEYKKDQYKSAYDNYVPGFTPLEQATNYYQAFLDKQAILNRKDPSQDSTPVSVSFNREDFANPALNHQLKLNSLSEKKKIEILNKISLLGKLGHQFDVEKEVGETVVANSDVYRKKVMRDYSQLDRISIYQRALPHFNLKFLTKDLIVDVPILTNEKKQKIIILLDYSGSMNEDKKQIWVNAILIDRLRYVIKGEAEVFFSYFVSSTTGLNFVHLKNAKDVDEFWRTFSNYPSGGTTDISRIVRYIADEVKRGKRLHNLQGLNLSKEKPEILIINDGQDSVNSDGFPYKVNAISLIQFSDQLKDLCVKTGGKQVKVDRFQDVSCYSPGKYETFEL